MQFVATVLVACWLGAAAVPAMAAGKTVRVLMLYAYSRPLPANIEADRGLRLALGAMPEVTITYHHEYLDSPLLGDDVHRAALTRYMSEKYANRAPEVVVALGAEALDFMLQSGPALFPRVPIVHLGVEMSSLRAFGDLPPNVVGQGFELDFVGTVEQALRWHPQAKQLLVVTGASERDRQWGARFRSEAGRFEGRVAVEFLEGLPTRSVLARLRDSGKDTLIYSVGYFQDGDGEVTSPRSRVEAMAAAAKTPIYGSVPLGAGHVGGYVPDYEAIGLRAGQTVRRLLDGAAPAAVASSAVMRSSLEVDWRQVQRWGIDPAAIPRDAVIRFRQPTFLEANRTAVAIAVVVFLIQSGLIALLLLERRRRRRVETDLQRQRHELAHASRLAITTELTGALAHELNQPLGAILSNADAAEMSLQRGDLPIDLMHEILADIRRDVLRASEVIRRLRGLFSKGEIESEPVDLRALLEDVGVFLAVEARRRGMPIDLRTATPALIVVGNRIEIQQVIINLVINAMDAMEDVPESRRKVTLSAERVGYAAVIEVRDHGHGIAPEHVPRLFESFFTTKRQGMGLGLAISRTLIEASKGRIWGENAPGGGAIFRVELPLDRAARMPSGEHP